MARLRVEDVFVLPGRGLAVTGRLYQGDVAAGDQLWLLGAGVRRAVTVCEVERFRVCFGGHGGDGADVGLLLAEVTESEVRRGMMLSSDGAPAAERQPVRGRTTG